MHCAKLAIALLGTAIGLWAADPFAGTWKLNPAQCKFKVGQPMKEQTVTMTDTGKDMELMVKGTTVDGVVVLSHYAIPTAGGPGKIIQSFYEAVASKSLGEREREMAFKKAGKVVYTVRTVVSADGKTLTSYVKGTDPTGKPIDGMAVLDRQ